MGTSIGYSSTIIASTIRKWNGKLITVDNDEKIIETAKKNFIKYNISDSIEIRNENVIDFLKRAKMKFDFIFLDIYKNIYPEVFDDCLRILKPDGILMADDTLFPVLRKDDEVFREANKKLDLFNKKVAGDKLIESVLLPFGDGVTMITKKNKVVQ